MSTDNIYLTIVLAGALYLFYTGKVRTDVTALLVLLAMILPWKPGPERLSPVLTVKEGFSGFGSSALMMVAAMFVLSAAMVRTGAAQMMGSRVLASTARTELGFQLGVLAIATLFSAVINDTTTVLVWMPIVIALCRERGYSPRRILLLLAYASLLGGQWTLIGTRSNIIISDYLRERTGEGLAFFAFTPIAAGVWLAVIVWFLVFGRRLLPSSGAEPSLVEHYEVAEYVTETMATPASTLVGKTLSELDLSGQHGVEILQVIRGRETMPPSPWLRIHGDDVLVIQGRISKITTLLSQPGLEVREELRIDDKVLRSPDLRMMEAVVAPNAELEGETLGRLDFHRSYGVSVLAISRRGKPVTGRPLHQRLSAGDALLLVGHVSELERLRGHPSFLLLESRPLPAVGRSRAWIVLGLMAAMVACSASRLLEPAIVIPLVAVIAVLTRCVGIREAYEAIDLQSLVVVGAMIAYGVALEKTGTAHLFAETVAHASEGLPPVVLLGLLLLLTVLMTQIIENAAVAVVLAPIGFEFALASGTAPEPFLLGVAICASTAFMTPVAHESTILVMGPGRYRFRDYVRMGAPLAVISWLTTTVLVPLFYPLR